MEAFIWLALAAAVFGICYTVDKAFTKKFRSKAQHMSGLAVRANKKYGLFGVILVVIGIAAMISGLGKDKILLWGGCSVLLMGICLAVHYLSFGIFYDGESFLVSSFGKKSVSYLFQEIKAQKLYVITGGSIVVELLMNDGSSVSLQSSMDGIYQFLDTAFAGWCMQTGHQPQECNFYDPSKSWWFPHEEEQ